jgi:hypothetical protein
MRYVEVTATATLWSMFACFLLFPRMGFRPFMHRTAMTLLVVELVSLAMWSYGSKGCVERPCAPIAETGRTAAAIDVPLLALGLIGFALVTGIRRWRRAQRLTTP